MLSHALVGTQASPLRKALIDSGLGDDLTGGGYGPHYRQAIFSTGLKGIATGDADKVESLVLETLASLAADGIDPDMLAASLNTVEFRLREANTGAFPRGLMYAMSAIQLWQHGGDPLAGLEFEEQLSSIKQHLADNPRTFEVADRGASAEQQPPHRGAASARSRRARAGRGGRARPSGRRAGGDERLLTSSRCWRPWSG